MSDAEQRMARIREEVEQEVFWDTGIRLDMGFLLAQWDEAQARYERLVGILGAAHDALREIMEDNPSCTTVHYWEGAGLVKKTAEELGGRNG